MPVRFTQINYDREIALAALDEDMAVHGIVLKENRDMLI